MDIRLAIIGAMRQPTTFAGLSMTCTAVLQWILAMSEDLGPVH